MKNQQIYKDLNTSFVSLSDLLKCLRKQMFVGTVHFKSGNYEADIFVGKDRQLKARENTKRNGKVLTNKEILRHVLLRARKPNGIVNVYKQEEANEPILKRLLPRLHKKFDSVKEEYSLANTQISSYLPRIRKQAETPTKISKGRKRNSLPRKAPAVETLATTVFDQKTSKKRIRQEFNVPKKRMHRKFDNSYPPMYGSKNRILTEKEVLLNLMNELFNTIDKNLEKANLNFSWMLEKTRLEVGRDDFYPNPDSTYFKYENGKIITDEKINTQLFVENILNVLHGILKKLRSNSKFKDVYLTVNQEILALIYDRKMLYDKFAITQKLKKIAIN